MPCRCVTPLSLSRLSVSLHCGVSDLADPGPRLDGDGHLVLVHLEDLVDVRERHHALLAHGDAIRGQRRAHGTNPAPHTHNTEAKAGPLCLRLPKPPRRSRARRFGVPLPALVCVLDERLELSHGVGLVVLRRLNAVGA